jgi:hypothetical protein
MLKYINAKNKYEMDNVSGADLCGVREGRHARAAGRPGQACAEKQVLRESDHPALRTVTSYFSVLNPQLTE